MIHLEIIESRDPNAKGEYQYHFDIMSIGQSLKNDLILKEKGIPTYAILLTSENDHLFLQTTSNDFFCYVNQTKLSGKKQLKVNDSLRIGDTEIKILDFKDTWPKLSLSELYQKFLTKFPEHQYILDALNAEMEFLERKHGKSK